MIIREMQHKLATWTAHDETRRVNRLLRLITHPDWLAEAARITLSSKGAHTPGVDGITKEHVQNRLNEEIQRIRSELLSGIYEPSPVRRVYIPKANGKQRPLGIPTLYDRIVQRAMLMAMEPIWENDFHKQSYGFRPERSVHHARAVPGTFCRFMQVLGLGGACKLFLGKEIVVFIAVPGIFSTKCHIFRESGVIICFWVRG